MMSRVKQRVAIGCPRSPRAAMYSAAETAGGVRMRVVKCCFITHLFVILLQGHESFY